VSKNAVSRRKFLRTSLTAVAGAGVTLAGYSQFIEPHRLVVEPREFSIPHLPEAFDGFRIVQLSDLHYGAYTGKRELSAVVGVANALKPDLMVLTGDFITAPMTQLRLPETDPVFSFAGQCAQVLSHLEAPHGVLGCLGNHDAAVSGRYMREAFRNFGIRLLVNENLVLERDGKRLWITGVDDAIVGTPDVDRSMKDVPANEPVLMLAHEPDMADEIAKYPVALQLSGHSHGGQIRLPFVDRLYLPELARKYPYGYYRVRDMHLYTNRGIGTIVLPYRFNAPPEITVVTLRAGHR
jgi:predicted MPP superfamily phosphohydrolase